MCVLLAFGAALILLAAYPKDHWRRDDALAAALLFLLYPGILVAEARAGIEIPSIFTVLLFMLVLYSAVEKGSLWRYWAAGLLLGVGGAGQERGSAISARLAGLPPPWREGLGLSGRKVVEADCSARPRGSGCNVAMDNS